MAFSKTEGGEEVGCSASGEERVDKSETCTATGGWVEGAGTLRNVLTSQMTMPSLSCTCWAES